MHSAALKGQNYMAQAASGFSQTDSIFVRGRLYIPNPVPTQVSSGNGPVSVFNAVTEAYIENMTIGSAGGDISTGWAVSNEALDRVVLVPNTTYGVIPDFFNGFVVRVGSTGVPVTAGYTSMDYPTATAILDATVCIAGTIGAETRYIFHQIHPSGSFLGNLTTTRTPNALVGHAGKFWSLCGNVVEVIDPVTRTLITTITLPHTNARAIGAAGNIVLVGESSTGANNKLTAIDATTNSIIRTFHNTANGFGHRIANNATKFFVPVSSGSNAVVAIDIDTITSGSDPTMRTIPLAPAGGSSQPQGAVVGENKLFITRGNDIVVVNPDTEVVRATRITHAQLTNATIR